MANPKFYKIDCDREVVLQGKTSFYFTIARNDDIMASTEDLIAIIYPQDYTFETHAVISVNLNNGGLTPTVGTYTPNTSTLSTYPSYKKVTPGLVVKNHRDYGYTVPITVTDVNEATGVLTFSLPCPNPAVFPAGPITIDTSLGEVSTVDGEHWLINGRNLFDTTDFLNSNTAAIYANDTVVENPFDGTLAPAPLSLLNLDGTGFVERTTPSYIVIKHDINNTVTRSATIRIDFDGEVDSHLKLNLLLAKASAPVTATDIRTYVASLMPLGDFGLKSANPADPDFDDIDYQELHFFGYPEGYIRTGRDETPMKYTLDDNPIYEDRSSFGLLKTNPKISGNVKITTDSSGEIWLNSFDANDELSDSAYKKFSISTASTYQKDLWTFFKKGQTPTDIVFDVYEFDDQYLNNKQTLDKQFDNFYNYGVEQLRSKFYDEDFTFLAPLWLRKDVPDFFIIFRVNHPFDEETYDINTPLSSEKFEKYFKEARIVKTFDMRESSKLGSYIRKISSDSRFKERPLEVSWEKEVATYWYGASYQNGTMTGKGEFLYDFYTTDRPVKEFEEYITNGFQRNGIISTNLLNLEFLFNDEEAELYSINRYFGLYVRENQLAEFEIEPRVLGKITNQSPAPKPGVDGEPYSTRSFVQTNPDGIQLPVSYYHSSAFTNNTSNIPDFQGFVVGKFPLPAMVDDPLRIFYVKDRDDVFKRAIALSEVDYGYPGTEDYVRATQIELFDTQEDISKYGGVSDIVSQFQADLLTGGNSQLRLHFFDQFGTGTIADDEELLLQVINYNDEPRVANYKVQLTATDNATFATVEYFIDQTVDAVTSWVYYPPSAPPVLNAQPPAGEYAVVTPNNITNFSEGQSVYVVLGGYYTVTFINPNPLVYPALLPGEMYLFNAGGPQNVPALSTVANNSFIAEALTGVATYTLNPINFYLQVDNYLTLDLSTTLGSTVVYDAWDIDVNYPSVTKTKLLGTTTDIDAFYRVDYEQFTWKMIANGVGLQPGNAWVYPQYDPDGPCYLTHFSNEGTATQTAKAFAAAVNSFENAPVIAWADGDAVYLHSKLRYEEGNTLLFTRKTTAASYYANLGFYERGNANRKTVVEQKTYTPLSTLDLNLKFNEEIDQPYTNQGYFLNLIKTPTLFVATFRYGVSNVSNYIAATTSPAAGNSVAVLPGLVNTFSDPLLPFSLDVSNLPLNVNIEFAYNINTAKNIDQYFVGGIKRNRNRAQISLTDAQNYWQDRKVRRNGTTTTGSSTVTIDTTGIYVGAPISGTGIPAGARVVDVNNSSIVIDQLATASGTVILNVGEISILNDKVIYQQWYQSLKGTYDRMKGWDVQGKYVYTLPYLDEPTFNELEIANGFNEYSTTAIIQLEDSDKEFYYSIDNRIVAYKLYRPVLGVFSMYPIKQFDFDFIFSDYSYTPTLEALKYFFDENSYKKGIVELDPFQNYIISLNYVDGTPVLGPSTFSAQVEAYDSTSSEWYIIDSIVASEVPAGDEARWLINTFYPFYDYDVEEFPYLANVAGVSLPAIGYRSSGQRNFDRRYLYRSSNYINGTYSKFYPTKFRLSNISLPAGPPTVVLRTRNYNYLEDKDVRLFNGFAGLQDITSIGDADVIQGLKEEGKYVESYTYQLLLSEYDRLRENYNKDWAVKSKVVPYIAKWVQEGTDARDNYYRLNNSLAFGLTNFSPVSEVDFVEPAVLTHEFPYLDAFPQAYPEENIPSSRSYMYDKLSDIAAKGMNWYDLITSDNTNDWFTKYFVVGYPTELTYGANKDKRPREERFTFFNFIEGLGRSQTLFRGAKIQPLEFNDDDPQNIFEVANSPLFDGYKFAAVARFENYNFFERQNPVNIEIVRNTKYKTIVMIITVRLKDYRWQYGGSEYMAQYFMTDLLTNSHQQQFMLSWDDGSPVAPFSGELRDFTPYNTAPGGASNYTIESVLRPRQHMFGGGYLRLGDKKLGGLTVDSTLPPVSPSYAAPNLTVRFSDIVLPPSTQPLYPFKLLQEVYPIANRYRFDITNFVTPGIAVDPEILPRNYGNDGFAFNFISTYKGDVGFGVNNLIRIRDYVDSQTQIDEFQVSQVRIGAANRNNFFQVLEAPFPLSSLYQPTRSPAAGIFSSSTLPYPTPPGFGTFDIQETYHLEGGTNGFTSLQNYLTFANISKLVNTDDRNVAYYNVEDTGQTVAVDYKIRFISPDSIIKKEVIHYSLDEDKPDEYKNTEYIGYNLVNTRGQEYIIRHRGFYEPKTRDVLSFWAREDNDFSDHFEIDWLLSNTHIDSLSANAGLIRNYCFNKVSTTGGNIMQIARTSAYKSLYPLIGEVAVDNKNYFSLDSSWDNNFYREYSSTVNYAEVEGIAEMKEEKTFLASKTMIVPKSFELHTFNNTEVTFQLIQPSTAIGVSELVVDQTTRNQSRRNAERPRLIITIDLRVRLLRQLLEEINSIVNIDEFERLQLLASNTKPLLSSLTNQQINDLKTSYFEKNIIDLYQPTDIILYQKVESGIQLVDLDLTEAEKVSAGYKVDKDCVVRQISAFQFEITKILDPKVASGFSLATTLKRI